MGTRTYYINEDFFHKIDTQEKAYFLGIMYGDGCVHLGTKNHAAILVMTDKHIVEQCSELITNKPVQIVNKPNPNHKVQYRMALYSKQICADLIRHGCIPQKSHVVRLPCLPNQLYRHFFRGVFDADGCVYWKKDYKPRANVNICSASENFLIDLSNVIPVSPILQKELM